MTLYEETPTPCCSLKTSCTEILSSRLNGHIRVEIIQHQHHVLCTQKCSLVSLLLRSNLHNVPNGTLLLVRCTSADALRTFVTAFSPATAQVIIQSLTLNVSIKKVLTTQTAVVTAPPGVTRKETLNFFVNTECLVSLSHKSQ